VVIISHFFISIEKKKKYLLRKKCSFYKKFVYLSPPELQLGNQLMSFFFVNLSKLGFAIWDPMAKFARLIVYFFFKDQGIWHYSLHIFDTIFFKVEIKSQLNIVSSIN
jgi:hypothetical protein